MELTMKRHPDEDVMDLMYKKIIAALPKIANVPKKDFWSTTATHPINLDVAVQAMNRDYFRVRIFNHSEKDEPIYMLGNTKEIIKQLKPLLIYKSNLRDER